MYTPTTADIASAMAYETMIHDPKRPEVRASYSALMRSIMWQGMSLMTSANPAGRPITVEWYSGSDAESPYLNSAAMRMDVWQNGHLWTFATANGATDLPSDHPMRVIPEGSALPTMFRDHMMNDVFRAVHDVYGHVHADSGFGPNGEFLAYRMHKRTLPTSSHMALWCETRGQNTWTNAYGDHPYMPIMDRPFGAQKAGYVRPMIWSV